MIVKGIELMQMIADGKIKDGTIINRIGEIGVFKYKFEHGQLYYNCTTDTITKFYSVKEIIENKFEILEDKTDEIKEIEVDTNNYIHTELGSFKGRKMDIAFVNKLNELIILVNKLNSSEQKKDR